MEMLEKLGISGAQAERMAQAAEEMAADSRIWIVAGPRLENPERIEGRMAAERRRRVRQQEAADMGRSPAVEIYSEEEWAARMQ